MTLLLTRRYGTLLPRCWCVVYATRSKSCFRTVEAAKATRSTTSCRSRCWSQGTRPWSCPCWSTSAEVGSTLEEDGWRWAGSRCQSTALRGSDAPEGWSARGGGSRRADPEGRRPTAALLALDTPETKIRPSENISFVLFCGVTYIFWQINDGHAQYKLNYSKR